MSEKSKETIGNNFDSLLMGISCANHESFIDDEEYEMLHTKLKDLKNSCIRYHDVAVSNGDLDLEAKNLVASVLDLVYSSKQKPKKVTKTSKRSKKKSRNKSGDK